MKKLLYITTNLQGSGGVSRILSVKLNHLIETYGYTIHVITTNNKYDTFFYEFNSNIVFHKIDFKDFGLRHLFKYKMRLQEIVNKINPNVIINCDNGFKGALLPFLINTKAALIYERHGSRYIKTNTHVENLKKHFADFLLDRSLDKYKAFIVLNEEEKKQWNGNNVKVLSNPLWFKSQQNINALHNKIALAIGRHSIEKQFDIMLKIWQKVIVDFPDWTLEIYGEKDGESKLEKLVKELNLDNHVKLFKPTKNIDLVYSKGSMLLNTSSSEAFGMTIIEAMAFGLPVIAFDKTLGPKSLIKNVNNGFLIKNSDILAYANKIKLLIQDDMLRQEMGKNAKESIKKFNLKNIMLKWHELFQSFD